MTDTEQRKADPFYSLLTAEERTELQKSLAEMARLRALAYVAAREIVL